MQLWNKLQGYTQNRIETFRLHGKKIPTNLKTKPEEKKKKKPNMWYKAKKKM